MVKQYLIHAFILFSSHAWGSEIVTPDAGDLPSNLACDGVDCLDESAWQKHKYRINGINMNVVVAGEGPDVLMIHGFPDTHEVWRYQIPALVAAGFRVIAPDTRGSGETDISNGLGSYTIDNLASDMIALLDRLNIKKARLVGHDWGAFIGWQMIMKRPDRIDRFFALSAGHPGAYATAGLEQTFKAYYILLMQFPGLSEYLFMKFHNEISGYSGENDRWLSNLSRPGRLTAGLNYYRANLGIGIPRYYAPQPVPVLGVWGSNDKFLTEQQMTASSRYVDALFRYRRLDGANHWLQLTEAPTINAMLVDYMKEDLSRAPETSDSHEAFCKAHNRDGLTCSGLKSHGIDLDEHGFGCLWQQKWQCLPNGCASWMARC